MKNTERQASLDKQRVLASKELAIDVSGGMPYCNYCEYWEYDLKKIPQSIQKALCSEIPLMCRVDNGVVSNMSTRSCTIPHEQRVENCLCAKAYNRMVRGTKK